MKRISKEQAEASGLPFLVYDFDPKEKHARMEFSDGSYAHYYYVHLLEDGSLYFNGCMPDWSTHGAKTHEEEREMLARKAAAWTKIRTGSPFIFNKGDVYVLVELKPGRGYPFVVGRKRI